MPRKKGFKHSEETRKKIGLGNSKIKVPIRGIIKLSYSEGRGIAVCEKCGKKRDIRYDTAYKIISGRNENICNSCSHSGKKYSAETNKKKGSPKEKNCKWKGGISTENNILRGSAEYKAWRTSVFKRDDYTCRDCGVRGCYLEAHHVELFSICKELIFEVKNGITLCKKCHEKIHKKDTAFLA
jgi:hypothetical protein